MTRIRPERKDRGMQKHARAFVGSAVRWAVIAAFGVMLIGAELATPRDEQSQLRSSLQLPWEATDAKDVGRGWHTFTMVIEGRPRRFLRHHGGGLSATECLVELYEPGLPSSSSGR
jgi:hypothetical protein